MRLMSIEDAAEILAISRASVYRFVKAGELPHVKLGGRTLIHNIDLRNFVDARRHSRPVGRTRAA